MTAMEPTNMNSLESGSVISIARKLQTALIGRCSASDLENARLLTSQLLTLAMRHDLSREDQVVRKALGLRQLRGGKILMLLVNNAGSFCSSGDIARALGTVSQGTIKVYMCELRYALAGVGLPPMIQTEWRKGYWISKPDAAYFSTWLSERIEAEGASIADVAASQTGLQSVHVG
ncbi:helix-turn-helix domain-containing protein [Sphingobium sp. B12D2B]|uniref:helix-turn-helix domain-containing protein n=1 Tax=Sphingobium sp. B12D2B TaxID=2940577 RepID=UPI0022246BCF|nr:helix-turn-helix domain-containing protein [Sphingobium sp. B12D2B]MCW2351803.1 DNA-binding winged helix-turn-helix (wHTH) protein [Sphingobium sp. B12D2B]